MTEPAAPPARTEPTLDSTTRADQSDELATTTMLRGAIGSVNTDYYLHHFTRFDAQDRAGPSWNTAAAFATLNWMLFRKMWNAALAYAGIALTLALLVFGIGKLAFHYPPEVQWALAGLYLLLLVAIPGLWGNALLFRQVRSDMAGALSANQAIADAAALLQSRAPTRKRLIVLAVLNTVLGGLLLALVLWAKDFQGMPSVLAPAENAPAAPVPAGAASGNVAVGKTQEAAPAPLPVASAPAVAASAPASAPHPAPVASAPSATASAPAAGASAPASKTSAPGEAPSAAPPTSAPVPAPGASAVTAKQPSSSTATTAKAEPLPKTSAKPGTPSTAATPTPPAASKKPAPTSSAEKAEATKLAPQASVQAKTPPAPTPSKGASAVAPRKPAAAPPQPPAADAPGVPNGKYGINVGLFADPNNARNAFVKLSDAGMPAYTQEMQGKKGLLTRVRVGPFDSLAEAERVASRIRTMGLDALVFQQGAQR